MYNTWVGDLVCKPKQKALISRKLNLFRRRVLVGLKTRACAFVYWADRGLQLGGSTFHGVCVCMGAPIVVLQVAPEQLGQHSIPVLHTRPLEILVQQPRRFMYRTAWPHRKSKTAFVSILVRFFSCIKNPLLDGLT